MSRTTSKPPVSVLLTTYNHAAFIDAALQSVLDQTYPHFEAVIADDGSTDGTADRVRSWASRDARMVPVLSPRNEGLSANWNRAIARCQGEFIALLSGDDLMLPDRLARQVAFMESHPACGICTHDMEVFDSASGSTLYRLSDRFARKNGGADVTLTTNWLFGREIKSIPSSHMFRASVVGAHRFDPRLHVMNEWLFEIECVATSGLQWSTLPDVLGRYRVHSAQLSLSAPSRAHAFEETLLVLAIAAARYPTLAPLIRRRREFAFFRHLVFDWFPPDERLLRDRQFRAEAGVLRWLYGRAVRLALRRPLAVDATRSLRRIVQALVHRG